MWRWSPPPCWTHGTCTSRSVLASRSWDSTSTSSSCLPLRPPHSARPGAADCPSATRCRAEGCRWPCTSASPSCRPGGRWLASASSKAAWSAEALGGEKSTQIRRRLCKICWEKTEQRKLLHRLTCNLVLKSEESTLFDYFASLNGVSQADEFAFCTLFHN